MPGASRLLLVMLMSVLVGCAEFRYDDEPPDRPTRSESAPSAYTVEPGDTLYSIAWRYGLDFHTVARWNGISAPYTIFPGQTLSLKGSVSTARRRSTRDSTATRASRGTASRSESTRRTSKPARRRLPPEPGSVSTDWSWPVRGRLIERFREKDGGKQGVVIAGEVGKPIKAAGEGRVVYAGRGLRGYGNLLIIKHSSRYLTAYGYNQSLEVDEGDRVAAGDTVARMGTAPGGAAALHFELRLDGRPVDPLKYLPE